MGVRAGNAPVIRGSFTCRRVVLRSAQDIPTRRELLDAEKKDNGGR